MNKFVIYLFGICLFFLNQKCDSAIENTPMGNNSAEVSSLPTECSLQDGTDAFCVSINDCLILLEMLDHPTLRNRTCGPKNENRKDPRVCCEKHLIKYRSTTPRTAPEESPESLETCGFQNINSRILGGEPSTEGEFPWLARIFRRDRQGELNFGCTGTLISAKVVLTAAHCLVSRSLKDQGPLDSVSLGEHETRCKPGDGGCLDNKETVAIAAYIVHPEYVVSAKNHDNDLGLIILRNEVRFTNHIWPICLLENHRNESEYYVAGWGTTEYGAASNVKLKTALAPYSWEQCAQKYRTLRVEITTRQICAGGMEHIDACQGDSGGPLMVIRNDTRWYVAGVVSFGVSCGKQGWPGIYVYVPKYIKWIREKIRQN